MIGEFELYHGGALTKLIGFNGQNVNIRRFNPNENSSYIIDNSVGLYLKYSTKRLSPWRFTFTAQHQHDIASMEGQIGKVFVGLICHRDGVVALSFPELKEILDEYHHAAEWVSISRSRGTMYSVKGSDGALKLKIGRGDFPKKLFELSQIQS